MHARMLLFFAVLAAPLANAPAWAQQPQGSSMTEAEKRTAAALQAIREEKKRSIVSVDGQPATGVSEDAQTSDKPVFVDAPVAPGGNVTADSRLLIDVFFELGSAKLSPAAEGQLQPLAAVMFRPDYAKPETGEPVRIRIDGHASADGDDATNLVLSEARASAVKSYLMKYGIAANRLEVRGFGELRPIAGIAPDNPRNRRVEVVPLN
jgi:OOP family OmpA-OmpF porin